MGERNPEDQMETVGGSCDYAFSSSSSDTALGLGFIVLMITLSD